jgi:hypothetical protein
MTSAVHADTGLDQTSVPHVLKKAVVLAVVQSALIALFSIVSHKVSGSAGTVVLGLILALGVSVTISLPGLWTKAATIEGIAGAAGIGLAAAGVFLLIDVALFQPIGLWGNRWREIGGGSNWWYHPVWWMVGTLLPWLGGWVLANQRAKSGSPNPAVLVVGTLVVAAVIMAIAASTGFPGASFGLGTFGVAVLPALVVMVLVTGLGARRA